MFNHKKSTTKHNSFKTRITDDATDQILAEWISLNERPDKERHEVSRDLYVVLKEGKMSVNYFINWFSGQQETIEAAQEFYHYDIFNPAAVFELPDGGFTLAYIREQNYPPHETAQALKWIVGYKMVSCCDPLLGIWKPYEEAR